MGIKFDCPNGHSLNVKSFLAGKRAKCPKCGAKVRVPLGASEDGAEDSALSAQTDGGPSTAPVPTKSLSQNLTEFRGAGAVVPGPRSATPSLPPADERRAPPSMDPRRSWFVRPPAGGQYGPSESAVIHQWLREGRIPPQSLMWQEGWTDWIPAEDAFREFFSPTAGEALAFPDAISSPTAPLTRPRNRKKDRTFQAIIVLSVAIVVLLAILIYLLTR